MPVAAVRIRAGVSQIPILRAWWKGVFGDPFSMSIGIISRRFNEINYYCHNYNSTK